LAANSGQQSSAAERRRGSITADAQFAPDSSLEETGFEPLVPLRIAKTDFGCIGMAVRLSKEEVAGSCHSFLALASAFRKTTIQAFRRYIEKGEREAVTNSGARPTLSKGWR
jgi:hypothetical protein